MSRSRSNSHPRARVSRVWLIVAAIIVLLALAAMVWLILDMISKQDSSEATELKKTPASAAVQSSSSQSEESSQTSSAPKPTPGVVNIIEATSNVQYDNILLRWESVQFAEGYCVYREKDGAWDLLAKLDGIDATKYEDPDVKEGVKYNYKIAAFAMQGDNMIMGESTTVVVEYPKPIVTADLYLLAQGTQIFDDSLALNYTLDEEGYYTGVADDKNADYIRIDFMLETRLVRKSDVNKVEGAFALPTSAIGQEGGEIYGVSACGPTAAAVIVRYDKNEYWNKDELIKYTEANGLADQGSMMGEVGEGGMSAPMILKLIEGYSQGKYHAQNLYRDELKTSEQLKEVLDSGKHCILSVRYAWGIVHHPYSIIHFVEPCAYSTENGTLYFYYVDTAYGNGPKGLKKVEATEIDESVVTVDSEPKCIIVLD